MKRIRNNASGTHLVHPEHGKRDVWSVMVATPGKLFAGRGWIFELKYDGFRCLASTRRGIGVRLESRNGRDMTACFPELAEELAAIDADLVVDGEVVICDEMGRPQWNRLHKRHMLRNPRRIATAATADPACIFAFDLPWLNGEDYRHFPLSSEEGAAQRGAVRPPAGEVRGSLRRVADAAVAPG